MSHRTDNVLAIVIICLGTFMIQLDGSIVILALPRIQADLHASLADLQWTVDAYTLPFAVLLLMAGTLGDRFGRKRFFLLGFLLFVAGSALCGFAPTLSWLLCGRVIQGSGAAALSTNSLALLVIAFPEPKVRAQAIGLFTGISAIALAVGPLIGGVLTQFGSWPLIFLVNLPLGVLALILAVPGLSESRNPNARQLDLPGQLLAIATLVCLVMALIESSSVGWTSPLIIGLFAGAVVGLSAFIGVETRVREPLIPLQLLQIPVFSAASLITFMLSCVLAAPVFFLAQYFQEVQGFSVLEAGLRTLPLTVGIFLAAPVAGRITSRIGPRPPIILGGLLCTIGMALLLTLEPGSSYASLWGMLALLGIGFGLMLSPLTAAIFSATPPERAGLGSSLFNATRQVGTTLSIAVLGTFVLQQFSNAISSQLIGRGVPVAISTVFAHNVAAAGAQASQSTQAEQLPIAPLALHQALNQAFVDALHGMFLIAAIALLVATLLAVFLLKPDQASKSVERVSTQAIPAAQVASAVNAEER
ncbi:MAG TPA: MFS transporter [Ktedonobacteraceae bacterium]